MSAYFIVASVGEMEGSGAYRGVIRAVTSMIIMIDDP
jgi:hypothetical protein